MPDPDAKSSQQKQERATDHPDGLTKIHLFTLRIWSEPLGKGRFEWRGKIEHINRPQIAYFREWESLTVHLQKMLSETD